MKGNVVKYLKYFALLGVLACLVACEGKNNGGGDRSGSPTPSGVSGEHTDNVTKPPNTVNRDKTYTYDGYDTRPPTNFNQHDYETASDRYILDYTTIGLYGFVFNDERNGYKVMPEMAADYPTDVTREYAGSYNVPEGASEGYAFSIRLREDAVWEDGTAINADTYVYSMRQLLDPHMNNGRAVDYYTSHMVIANAQGYVKSQSTFYQSVLTADGEYTSTNEDEWLFSLTQKVHFFGDYTAKDYYEQGYAEYFIMDGENLYEKYSESDAHPLTDEVKEDIMKLARSFDTVNKRNYAEFCVIMAQNPISDFGQVGIRKIGEYEIAIILDNPITMFYLYYNLMANWIVHEGLYEMNKYQDDGGLGTHYATGMDTYISYGPYKLASYEDGVRIVMERNDRWYGYTDGRHEGMWQTDRIVRHILASDDEALDLFVQGGLCEMPFNEADIDIVKMGEHISLIPQSFTTKVTFNTDYETLKSRQTNGINKTIASYMNFRKAFSRCIDRERFVRECTASYMAGYGLLNYLYIYDLDLGVPYRLTDEATRVLGRVYETDDGTTLAGYDIEQAGELFMKAYKEALADGEIGSLDTIELEYLYYDDSDEYARMHDFFQRSIDTAIEGTILEGRIRLIMKHDRDYDNFVKQGNFDMSFTTWGGSTMDVFKFMEVYVVKGKYLEYGFDSEVETLTIEVEGNTVTQTYLEWYEALNNGDYKDTPSGTKLRILAEMERGLLDQYRTVPVFYRYVPTLLSKKVRNGTDVYNNLLYYGGIKYMEYVYDDEAWREYCESAGY